MRRSLQSYIFTCLFLFSLVACSSSTELEPPECNGTSIAIIPTATRQSDPDLFSLPVLPEGGDGAAYCPTLVPSETPTGDFPAQFVTTEVVNLSLDVANQDLAATAIGDDMIAVAWISDSDIYVALSRGGSHFQMRRVDRGSSVALIFSEANRLHVAYEQDGEIFYLAADHGTHPADAEREFVAIGTNPIVALNQYNYAQIIFENNGIYHAAHILSGEWLVGQVEDTVSGDGQLTMVRFGVDLDLGYVIAYRGVGGGIHIAQWRTTPYGFFPFWESVSIFSITADEELMGTIGLDFLAVSDEAAWVYATWVTKRPFPDPPIPRYNQPIYEAVNPLFPDQIANANHIYEGLNAVRWRTEAIPFDAGLMQTITVSDFSGTITFEAWGLAETAVDADMALRIGIDPTGGDNPDSPDVVWSEMAAPTDFAPFTVNAPAQGSAATVFLRGTLNTADVSGTAVWDSATIQNSTLINGDFEGSFISQDSITVPDGWTPYYQDSGNTPINGRDVYTVYAIWSDDGGATWIGPEAIITNRDLSGGTIGAIRPDVTPIISSATETPSVSFFYIYEAGDPPPDTEFLRFGRPFITMCDLGTTSCTDSPGAPLLPRNVVRPSYRLLVASDPFNPDRAILTWDSLQTDALNKDVYATYAVLR